jgi:hypothetical protein
MVSFPLRPWRQKARTREPVACCCARGFDTVWQSNSHEEFYAFIIPVVKEKKVQAGTVNTIQAQQQLGIPKKKIRMVFNKLDTDESAIIAAFYLSNARPINEVVTFGCPRVSSDDFANAYSNARSASDDPTVGLGAITIRHLKSSDFVARVLGNLSAATMWVDVCISITIASRSQRRTRCWNISIFSRTWRNWCVPSTAYWVD